MIIDKKFKLTENELIKRNDKALSVFSYLSILVLIPLIAVPDSKFAEFHIKQGVNLLVLEIIYAAVNCLIKLVINSGIDMGFSIVFAVLANFIFGVFIVILSLIGVINVVTGKIKRLPLIGKMNLIK